MNAKLSLKHLTFVAILAISGLMAPTSRADHPVDPYCSGGPKTLEWTSWKTVGYENGVEVQSSVYMERRLFGYKTTNQIRFRYLNHRSSLAEATVGNVTIHTRAGETFNLGQQTVVVPGYGETIGDPFTVKGAKDKICTYNLTLDVRR